MSRGAQNNGENLVSGPMKEWKKPPAYESRGVIDETAPIMMLPEKALFAVEFLLALGISWEEAFSQDTIAALHKVGLGNYNQWKIYKLSERLQVGYDWDLRSLGIDSVNPAYQELLKLRHHLQGLQNSEINARELIGRALKLSGKNVQDLLRLLLWIKSDSIKPDDIQLSPDTSSKTTQEKLWGYDP